MGPFDRFNDRAKRVLALAQDEAIRFNHNYIGPEHLILGLLREGEGVAARALDALGIGLSQLRSTIEFLVGRGTALSSPSEITLHPRTKKIIELAIDEARRLGHSHVGTEHLLLGIVREGADSMAGRAVESLGVSLERIRQQVIATLGQQHVPPAAENVTKGQFGRTEPSAERVLSFAHDVAKTLGHDWVGTEHVLLALMSVDSPASRVLGTLGVTYDKALASVTTAVPRRDATPAELTVTPRVQALIGYAKGYADGSGGALSASTLLLGLVADPDGVGAQVLVMLGVTTDKVREAIAATGRSTQTTPSSRTYRPPLRLRDVSLEDLDDSAKAILARAAAEAKRLDHNYVGTEHLLAAIAGSDPGTAAAKALARLGVEISKVRTALEFIVGRGDAAATEDLSLSPRTLTVLELARGQARALRHAKVSAADLLLGLVDEGQGIAAGIMESLGITLDRVRQAVYAELGTSPTPTRAPRSAPGPFDRFTDRTKRVLALAQDEAIRLGHTYIGTEHLLLGLLCEGSSLAAEALKAAGLEIDAARAEVERIVGRGAGPAVPAESTLSPRTKKVLDLANDEAQRLGAPQTKPAHLLLGMLREGEGIGCQIIEAAHVSLEALRADVLRRMSEPGANPSS